jgi:hypothetical protein
MTGLPQIGVGGRPRRVLRPEPSEREQLTTVTPELGVETPERERRLSRELEVMNSIDSASAACGRQS